MTFDRRNLISFSLSIYFLIWIFAGPIDYSYLNFRNSVFSSDTVNVILFFAVKLILAFVSIAIIIKPKKSLFHFVQFLCGSLYLFFGFLNNDLIWNYNTHVLLISFLNLLTRSKYFEADHNRDLQNALSLIFASIYLQAATSKLHISGIDWMASGSNIYLNLLDFNPIISNFLSGNKIVFMFLGWLTVIGELLLAILFIIPRFRKTGALLALLFHCGIWLFFNISFWHLWIFLPATYLSANDIIRFKTILKNRSA